MLDGLGAARSGLSAQSQRMDALANDIANVNTAGYSPERTSFEDVVARAAAGQPTSGGVAFRSNGPASGQGPIVETGNPLDLAIEGDGWFQVSRPTGQIALVRAGAFGVDANGQVVTATGERLFPPLSLPPGTNTDALRIDPSGVATVNGQQIGQVQIVTVPAPSGLIANGDGTFSATVGSGTPSPATGSAVVQGALEQSGTDLAESAVEMTATHTAFDAAARSLSAQYDMLGALIEMADRGRNS
jgi:flagellar basal-body rod protein FlgG